MLNHAETTSSSTIVSVAVACSHPQELVANSVPALSATSVASLSVLFEHPDFQRGFTDGHAEFLDSYEPEPLTEEEMIEEVEMNLSRRITERCQKIYQSEGWQRQAGYYLYNLGFVVGTIDQGLTYAQR